MKRLIKVFLAMSIVTLGVLCGQMDADSVQAATLSEDGYVVLTSGEYTWSDENKTNHAAPVATADGYTTWLFAGWYSDSECKTAITDIQTVNSSSYAKFVKPDTLRVLAQTSADGNKIRFVSSVDSLDYQSAGFTIEGVGTNSTTKVFQRIETTTEGMEYEFSPKVVGSESEYFVTAKLSVTDTTKNYVVKAFWITNDGTKVCGASRCVSASDGAANVINIPFVELNMNENLNTEEGSYHASLFEANATEAKYSDLTVSVSDVAPQNVKITLPDGVTNKSLQSATKIVIYDADDTFVADYIYRNYFASYTPSDEPDADGNYTITGDTSWYDIDTSATEFVIASVADLYGFASLVDDEKTFEGVTVTLIRDITVNEGTAVSEEVNDDGSIATQASWQEKDGENKYLWNPIGTGSYFFKGQFDGDHNTISGLYYAGSDSYVGLFARIENSTLKNVRLTNSYLKTTGDYFGGIVGFSHGTSTIAGSLLRNVYSDVILVSTGSYVGGITGRVVTNVTIQRSWFAGEIYVSNAANYIGGIASEVQKRDTIASFEDCLNTGYIKSSCTESCTIGGIFSRIYTASASVNLNNCLVLATIDVQTNDKVGAFFTNYKGTYTIDKCYAIDSIQENNSGMTYDVDVVMSSDELSTTTLETLFTDASAWTKLDDGTPILKAFAEWWVEENAQ